MMGWGRVPTPVRQRLCLLSRQPLAVPLLFSGWLLHLPLVVPPPPATLFLSSASCCAAASCPSLQVHVFLWLVVAPPSLVPPLPLATPLLYSNWLPSYHLLFKATATCRYGLQPPSSLIVAVGRLSSPIVCDWLICIPLGFVTVKARCRAVCR